MQAAILSIGDELTLGQHVDTNSAWLARQLLARSIVTAEHRTLGDDRAAIARAVAELAATCDLLLITGGLGPTADDLTRPALGDVLTPGEALVTDEEAVRHVRRWFAGRKTTMPPANLAQARRPSTMRMIPNDHGTAPGLAGEHGRCSIYVLPGPPREMKAMFDERIARQLPAPEPGRRLITETIRAFGLGESRAAQILGDLAERDHEPMVGLTAAQAIISARIRHMGEEQETCRLVEETATLIERLWTPYCFGRGETTLPEAAGELLRAAGRTVVTAESCTGGWLGKQIVDVPGSSAYYLGGWVTYSNEMKIAELGVPAARLDEHGAVSEPVAASMAEGALDRGGADDSLAITGVAGPEGGGPGKPAGTVFIALARRHPDHISTSVRRFAFRGDRATVRDRSAKAALQMLRFALLGVGDDQPLLWETAGVEAKEVDGI
ncbi:MAG: CinA family nicotinamide mononucleotide deamidase-related protein [Planctomycetota bacterium]|nr:CinA family nicotinamide mononucleotide deamidase-related protein [Planctomycetota bacterium]